MKTPDHSTRTSRRFPRHVRGLLAALGITLVSTGATFAQANVTNVLNAATAFLATLSTTYSNSTVYTATLANAGKWSNIPVGGTPRNGVQFVNFTSTQIGAALNVGTNLLSARGIALFDEIRKADGLIGGASQSTWGSNLYSVAFVGVPSTTGIWMPQMGGHHMAYNITFNGTYHSGTPMFIGTEPNSWTNNGVVYSPLGLQRSTIISLRQTLTTAAQLTGTFSGVQFGPSSYDTTFPKNYDAHFATSGRGQSYTNLTTTQQGLVKTFILSWVTNVHETIATNYLADYLTDAALAETFVGYSGSSTTLATAPNYFRVDGPRVWIEFSVENGVAYPSSVHDHGLWRDKLTDYGAAFGTNTISTTNRLPTITTHPTSLTNAAGSSASFTVAATGTGTMYYQWYKDAVALSSATNATYTDTSVATGDAGTYSAKVWNHMGIKYSSNATLTVGTSVSITTTSPLTDGTVGSAYSQTLAATGGTSPYTWTTLSGTLPTGLALSSGGVLSGTPTAAGTFNFTVQVTDSASATATKAFAVTIGTSVSITTTSPLTGGTVGSAYSQTLAATGGTSPYTWTTLSGTLPTGLALSSGGVLSGTPTAAGTFNFTVQVTDSASATATKAFAVTIGSSTTNTAPTLAAVADQTITPGTSLSITNVATDSDTPAQTLTFALLTAPTNATLNTGSGVLAWRPLIAQANSTNAFSVSVTDSGSPAMSATQSFTVFVSAATAPSNTVVGYSSGIFEFSVGGIVGPDYIIQASTNLSTWETLSTTTPTALPFSYTDSGAGSYPLRFYRVLLGP